MGISTISTDACLEHVSLEHVQVIGVVQIEPVLAFPCLVARLQQLAQFLMIFEAFSDHRWRHAMLDMIDGFRRHRVEEIVEEDAGVAEAARLDKGVVMVGVIQWNPRQSTIEVEVVDARKPRATGRSLSAG
jgi:hypothetical protein